MFLRVEEKAAFSKLPNEVNNIWYPNQRLLRKESYSTKHLKNIHPKLLRKTSENCVQQHIQRIMFHDQGDYYH